MKIEHTHFVVLIITVLCMSVCSFFQFFIDKIPFLLLFCRSFSPPAAAVLIVVVVIVFHILSNLINNLHHIHIHTLFISSLCSFAMCG